MTTELRLLSRVAYREREIAAPRLRGLLALLAGDLRRGASAARLVDGLWPEEQPENPGKALQVLVSRARAQLGAGVIASTPNGYRLALDEDQVDSSAVLRSASASARSSAAGDHVAALAQAEAGLALWEGTPDAEEGLDDPVSALRAERLPTYRSLLRARALALSRLGRHAEAAGALAELFAERPRDEEVLLELLRCEAATLGPSAALDRYEAYRRSLRDELGTDPGPALQAMQQELLRGTAPAVRRGVPHEPNPLLGRDGDVAAVESLLRSSRVTSIVGPGGLGKTRLAYAVSRRAEQRVVQVVALAGVTSDGDVAAEVAAAVGSGEARRTPPGPVAVPTDVVAGIVAALGPGPALLVLDNCEHVLDGAAELVRALVSMTQDLRVLTTSRAPLGLSSESVYLLPGLDLATSVELFEQRARAARPGAELPGGLVEEVCRHLDGLPLAVELAAARVRLLSVAEIARRLQDRFSLLRGGARDAPERHQTLEAVVDWSWNLLDPAGQAAMRALSVFPGRFTAEAAARVLADGDVADVPRTLEHLVDQSLLRVSEEPGGTRLRMLETVRAFSARRRDTAGESDQALGRFLTWARELGVAEHELPLGADPFEAVTRIRAEQDNLLQALRQALAAADGGTVAATFALLGALWMIESGYTRVLAVAGDVARALSHFRPEPGLVEVTRTALTLCAALSFLFNGPRADRSLVALRRLPPAPPDTLVRACALVLGTIPAGPEALERLCDSDQPLVAGAASGVVTYLRENQGDQDGALKAAEGMLEGVEGLDGSWVWALGHCRIAELCLQVERGAQAQRHLLAALPVLERLGAWPDVVGLQWWMVLASLQAGDVDEAERWLKPIVPHPADEPVGARTYRQAVEAEILLARGEVEAGLGQWREVVDALSRAEGPIFDVEMDPGREPWVLEATAVAVVAHAQHHRIELVADLAGELPRLLSNLLAQPVASPLLVQPPICGALLLALAMADLELGALPGGRPAPDRAARMIALAERLRFLRGEPTMSSARARRAAEHADRPAYEEASSAYAGLSTDELLAAAAAALREREPR